MHSCAKKTDMHWFTSKSTGSIPPDTVTQSFNVYKIYIKIIFNVLFNKGMSLGTSWFLVKAPFIWTKKDIKHLDEPFVYLF